jgi:hypothetical protein
MGIRAEDEVEKEGKSLSKLNRYINDRKDWRYLRRLFNELDDYA